MALMTTTNGKQNSKSIISKNKNASSSKNKMNSSFTDFKVCKEAMENPEKFAELARWGREEIKIAEKEMPGLMAL